ncbi:MAG: glycerol-3-phosphate dehydrogenase [SAR324 cluster bacterium]|nr:glycerol-3-phosphate dehydrogenase [SAR324 cluster bacterium]MCZ6645507.1 glycerol-3-phosphate dehydrogenase [SAR324 cluster bacterium]
MEFDVAVVGGGINGTGIAREAAYRGFRTLLLEKDDIAQATSSQSTKMIHGGIRYLETWDFHLVHESLRERWTLLKIAPHLVKPFQIVIPVYKGSVRRPWMIRLGTLIYDLLAVGRNIGRSRRLRSEEVQAIPGLKKDGLLAAIAYPDAQVFDARLCLETALSAQEVGAVVLNYHPVERVTLENGHYRLQGTHLRTGAPYNFSAKSVVNATGPWTPIFERLTPGHPTKEMVYDRGIHLVVPSLGITEGLALMTGDKRLIFVLPWQEHYTLIGTTESKFEGEDFSSVPYSEEEVSYLLDKFNAFFPERNLTRGEVLYVYSGVRTLIAGHESSLTRLSREAEINLMPDQGGTAWMNVYGGKLTSYRRLAEQAINKLARHVTPSGPAPPRFTASTPLYGGRELVDIPPDKNPAFLTPELRDAWRGRYGSNWAELVDLALAQPKLQEMLLQRFQYTLADLAYMVTVELAFRLEDLTFRRTKMIYGLTENETRKLSQALEQFLKGQDWDSLYGEAAS